MRSNRRPPKTKVSTIILVFVLIAANLLVLAFIINNITDRIEQTKPAVAISKPKPQPYQKPKFNRHTFKPITKLHTSEKIIALTFDACGGKGGNGYDAELIDYLIQNQIPATLFISGKWIDANKKTFSQLASNPLFEIQNHGLNHKPLTVNGKTVYGIKGTKNFNEAVFEVDKNARKIAQITGAKPMLYRSGTAYYDQEGLDIIRILGYLAVNFDILSQDANPKTPKQTIKANLLKAKPGSIVAMHMNKPQGNTYEAVKEALPILHGQGYRFVKLQSYL